MIRLPVTQSAFLDGERAGRIFPITGFLHPSTRFLPYSSTIHLTSYAPQRSCRFFEVNPRLWCKFHQFLSLEDDS